MKKGSAGVWAVWIILTILIAGGLVYYYQYIKIPDLENQINDLKNQLDDLQEQANEGLVDNSLVYKNEEYGFQVSFTETFTGYEVEEETTDTGDAEAFLRVYVPKEGTEADNTKPGFVNPLVFSVYTSNNWDTVQAQDGPKPTLVGRTDNYVIGYSMWQDCPDADTEFCSQFTSETIKSVIESFKKI